MGKKIPVKDALEAIEGSGGIITAIAQKLGCTRKSIYNLQERSASVKQAIQDERERLKDVAESKLMENIEGGDNTAIIFYLKTQAKDRGYVERQEVTGKDGGALQIRADDFVQAARLIAGMEDGNSD